MGHGVNFKMAKRKFLLRSFIEVPADSHFPIQNLPFGAFRRSATKPVCIGVAIGDYVLDISFLENEGFFKNVLPEESRIFNGPFLNPFMALGKAVWKKTRQVISDLLREDNPVLRDNQVLRKRALLRQADVQMQIPVNIPDYTDFYSSREHATNVGIMFRGKDNALMPNWLHLPVAYHGRASSVVLGGTPIRRPVGQTVRNPGESPRLIPSRLLDFELETGFLVGPGNELGNPVPVDKAMDHIFGMVLVNDWSARDIQRWEYQPLGPFLGKNFATSISLWVVTMEALEPFRTASPVQDPVPLPYLQGEQKRAYDINLEVWLKAGQDSQPFTLCRSNFKYLYWTICQQLAHHTVNGCNLRTGDLLASGTISGSSPDSYGSLLELTWGGSRSIKLPDGQERKFLQDGDILGITGWCQGEGYRVGFGEVVGQILAVSAK
jgi:fumarylacetoacetase